MSSASKLFRNLVAGACIMALPLSATAAAVRPNAAVPAAGATAVVAQADEEAGFGVAWAALAVIALAVVVAIWIAVDDDSSVIS